MVDSRYPALLFQGILLAANISFLLAGENGIFIIISLTVLMLLFVIQVYSGEPRFMYLFPVNQKSQNPTPAIDTLILKWSIIISAFTFYLGAIHSSFKSSYFSFHFMIEFILALLVIAFPLIFKKTWERYFSDRNQRLVDIRAEPKK